MVLLQQIVYMKNYINKWTIPRLLQLIVGFYFIWNYMEDGMIFSLIFGALMGFQAVVNIGCFSSKGCSTPTNSSSTFSVDDDIDFEEVE